MRSICFALILASLVIVSACSTTRNSHKTWPDNFRDALEETYELSQDLERHVVTKSWERARKESAELVYVTQHLKQYQPLNGVTAEADFKVYENKVAGLNFAAANIQRYTQLHKHPEAVEWVDTYITRYNEIATKFGDGRTLTPTARPRGIAYGDYNN